jgi:hypothetical protein
MEDSMLNIMVTQRDGEVNSQNAHLLNPFKKLEGTHERYRSLGSTPTNKVSRPKEPWSDTQKKKFGFRTRRIELKSILESCSPKEQKYSSRMLHSIQMIQDNYDVENDEMQRCVDAYQEQLMVGVAEDKLQSISQIQERNRFQDQSNFDNFLNPDIINALISNDKNRIKTIIKNKKKKIWKPSKLELNKTVKNIINQSEI